MSLQHGVALALAHVRPRARMGAGLLACCALLGCAVPAARSPAAAAVSVEPLVRLALPPGALGCSVAVQQRLTVLPPNAPGQALEALLEVDAQQMQLALFHMGQRMGVLTWDGQQLHRDLSRWWPSQLAPEQVLSDLQLALWPTAAIRQALPSAWVLKENESGRSLLQAHEPRIFIQKTGANALEIHYPQGAWALRIESPGGMQLCPGVEGRV